MANINHYNELVEVLLPRRIAICVKDILAKNPTADVVEVKHGKWIPVQYAGFVLKRYECSLCNGYEYFEGKYCSNCGAKMNDKE